MGRKRKNNNQNNTSAAKVVKRNGKKQNQNALNPLFMIEILPKILNYLDIDNLKRSRLVCKLWGFEGGKILLQKSNIKLEPFANREDQRLKTQEENRQLGNFLSTAGISTTFKSTIKNIQQPKRMKNILPLLLQRTHALSLNPRYSNATGNNIVQFLQFFPHLQVLNLIDSWKATQEDFSAETKKFLVEKFESLQEIRLTLYKTDNVTNLLLTNCKSQLSVKQVYVQGMLPRFFEKYLQSGCNWPIETLVIDNKFWILRPQLLNNIRVFLEKISGSLKCFKWSYTSPQYLLAQYSVPWANNLINPSALNRLEIFKTGCERGDALFVVEISWLLFTFALQLPNLKSLTINRVPPNLEEKIQTWNNHPAANGRTLKSESLEELDFILYRDEVPIESFFVFSRRLWPNLKSLCIENPPNDLPTSGFLLSKWIGLERLDLKFENMCEENASLWKNWLTGRDESDDQDSNTSQDEDANCTLKDLRDLKHFGLWEDWQRKSTRIATDFMVNNSLKFMTQLQSLRLYNSKVSKKGKKMLKETLGPNVSIIIDN